MTVGSALHNYRLPESWGTAVPEVIQAQAKFDQLVTKWQDIANKINRATALNPTNSYPLVQSVPNVPLLPNSPLNNDGGASRIYNKISGLINGISYDTVLALADDYRNNANNELTAAKAELDRAKANLEKQDIHYTDSVVGTMLKQRTEPSGTLAGELRTQFRQLLTRLPSSMILIIALHRIVKSYEEISTATSINVKEIGARLDKASQDKNRNAIYITKLKSLQYYADPKGDAADTSIILGQTISMIERRARLPDNSVWSVVTPTGDDLSTSVISTVYIHRYTPTPSELDDLNTYNELFAELYKTKWKGQVPIYVTLNLNLTPPRTQTVYRVTLAQIKEAITALEAKNKKLETEITTYSGLNDRSTVLLSRNESKRRTSIQLSNQIIVDITQIIKTASEIL